MIAVGKDGLECIKGGSEFRVAKSHGAGKVFTFNSLLYGASLHTLLTFFKVRTNLTAFMSGCTVILFSDMPISGASESAVEFKIASTA